MTKLQRHKNKVSNKIYNKWVIVIPEEIIKKAELREGNELIAESDIKGKIIIRKK